MAREKTWISGRVAGILGVKIELGNDLHDIGYRRSSICMASSLSEGDLGQVEIAADKFRPPDPGSIPGILFSGHSTV